MGAPRSNAGSGVRDKPRFAGMSRWIRSANTRDAVRKRAKIALVVSAIVMFVVPSMRMLGWSNQNHAQEIEHCNQQDFSMDGGDCQAIGEVRRPTWACPEAMKKELQAFLDVYERRHIRNNSGGMLFDHSFALWYTLRATQPETIIESGAFRGHSTWIMKQALPDVRIISIDPRAPERRLDNVQYMVQGEFADFSSVNWASMKLNPDTTLVFLDDHQSGYRRMREGMRLGGFYKYIAEDNYAYPTGDNESFKWICERSIQPDTWRGFVQDRFGTEKRNQTWLQHLALGEELKRTVKTYYEFPPIASSALTRQTRYKVGQASRPIVSSPIDFARYLSQVPLDQFGMYTHFSYIEMIPGSDPQPQPADTVS